MSSSSSAFRVRSTKPSPDSSSGSSAGCRRSERWSITAGWTSSWTRRTAAASRRSASSVPTAPSRSPPPPRHEGPKCVFRISYPTKSKPGRSLLDTKYALRTISFVCRLGIRAEHADEEAALLEGFERAPEGRVARLFDVAVHVHEEHVLPGGQLGGAGLDQREVAVV